MSDILIHGMEMPTNGNETIIRIQPDGTVLDQYGHYLTITAVSVPPHGRTIDADAIFKDICDDINAMTAVGIAVDGQWLWDKLNDALENAPTIIPASEED